ncbi:hypothetical protein HWD99_06085 [Microbacterium sp. C5A9]|uniref:hypothetical protein n=1 Tax=Microbacterium sp. C5A9 TaxID=2736663 RepID=UPI001F51A13A|nr:hypothetical protein [Microbacterium sp. C5A9]MCI1018188.1 hypothetical protein [Microbacterium sp. C5A9]
MNIALGIGLIALGLKFTSDVLSEIRTIREDGRGDEKFNPRDLGHLVPFFGVLSSAAALAAGVIALMNS